MNEIERHQLPPEAVQAAVKLLWDKRSMLPENSEEIVEDVLCAAIPHLDRIVVEVGDELARKLASAPGIDPMRSLILERWRIASHPSRHKQGI
jgi:hypothetical protein